MGWCASVSTEIGFHRQKDLVVFFLSLISKQQSLTANSCIQTEGFSVFYFPSVTCKDFFFERGWFEREDSSAKSALSPSISPSI